MEDEILCPTDLGFRVLRKRRSESHLLRGDTELGGHSEVVPIWDPS